MSGGIAAVLILLGVACIVMGVRGTYADVFANLTHPSKGSEAGGAGLATENGSGNGTPSGVSIPTAGGGHGGVK